jgi:hypothetical protein
MPTVVSANAGPQQADQQNEEQQKMTDATGASDGGNYAQMYVPTFREKFWRTIGFRYHLGDEPPDAENLEGWSKTVTHFRFGVPDRFRLLLSSHLGSRRVNTLQRLRDSDLSDQELHAALCVIIEWYERLPNDELPDDHTRDAFRMLSKFLGVPSK